MAKLVGSNFNVSDDSVASIISIDSTIAKLIAPATPIDKPHIRLSIFNAGNQTLWVRFYPASQDNIKHGEVLLPGQHRLIELPNMPTSEISAIFNSGGARNVHVQYI
jgi:hypothetical protein